MDTVPTTSQSTPTADHDRVLPVTRLVGALLVPALLTAFTILFFFPTETGRLFAWPVNPTMSAMMLGATYLGGAYFFTRVALGISWRSVRLGFIPVTTFAGTLGIATLLHWERFTPGHIAFILWVFLYFTTPFLVPYLWYRGQQASRGKPVSSGVMIGSGLRWVIGALGVVMVIASAILLIFPEMMIGAWPWALTPLTARVMAAMFALPGVVGIGVARDGRWSSAKIIFEAQALTIVFIFIAMARAAGEISWGMVSAWTFIGGLLGVLALIGVARWRIKEAK
jgi:hypothetical protein